MKKGAPFWQISFFCIVIIGILFCGRITLYGQDADPFYLSHLHKGEKSFHEKDYKDAVKELEIAVFGHLGRAELKAKACIYLSLANYYLGNLEKSGKYLKEVEKLTVEEEFTSLGVAESVLSEFQKLANFLGNREIQEEGNDGHSAENENPGDQESTTQKSTSDLIKELEMKIRSDPHNIALYYELFKLYKKCDNLKGDKKIIKTLIKKNPAEVIAYQMLGITFYNERNYKEAAKIFVKIFDLTKDMRIDLDLLGEAGAYLILSTHLGGDQNGAVTMVTGLLNYMPEDQIISPSLNQKDKAVLQEILKTYKHRSGADRNK